MNRPRATGILACVLVLACVLGGCATEAMIGLAVGGDRSARVTSAWSTEGGGLALLLEGLETAWSDGGGVLALSGDELEQALGQEAALAVDSATLPQVVLGRERLVHGWRPGAELEPTLLEEVLAERADASGWAGVHAAGVDGDGHPRPWRVVYRPNSPSPRGDGERLLAVLVVGRDPDSARVRRAVFFLERYEKGLWRKVALISLGVAIDVGMVALLTL